MMDTLNNQNVNLQQQVPEPNGTPPFPPPPPPKEKTVYRTADLLMLIPAFAAALIMDLLVLQVGVGYHHINPYIGYFVFWLAFSVAAYLFYWEKAKKNMVAWLLTAVTVLLSLWGILFEHTILRILSYIIIPCIFMTNIQIILGNGSHLVVAWFWGWTDQIFSAVQHFFGAGASLFSRRKGAKNSPQIWIGLLLGCLLLLFILPLLLSADDVFYFYTQAFLQQINAGRLILHGISILCLAAICFSFLWNLSHKKELFPVRPVSFSISPITAGVALGMVLVIYLLFITVQFTYLFGRLGLPNGMTYADYAKSGFNQLLVVVAINVGLFALCVNYSDMKKLRVFLLLLLFSTVVILASGLVRMLMYIGAYGLTWKRLLSFAFMLFLAVAILLCVLRLFFKGLPLFRSLLGALVAWYVLLCFANPDNIMARYNLTYHPETSLQYVLTLSDDAVPALAEYYRNHPGAPDTEVESYYKDGELMSITLEQKLQRRLYRMEIQIQTSYSSIRARTLLDELFPEGGAWT